MLTKLRSKQWLAAMKKLLSFTVFTAVVLSTNPLLTSGRMISKALLMRCSPTTQEAEQGKDNIDFPEVSVPRQSLL